MTIEEKAKRYDEALKEASIAHKDEDRHLKATLERIFHELKDSEDEKIRKHIVTFIMEAEKMGDAPEECAKWLAWLEKQGEKKPSKWSERDERAIHCLEYTVKHFYEGEDTFKWWCDWFKSLKDRVQQQPKQVWKPSDEQMEALQYIYRNINPPLSDKLGWNSLRTLELMYQELKKLRER